MNKRLRAAQNSTGRALQEIAITDGDDGEVLLANGMEARSGEAQTELTILLRQSGNAMGARMEHEREDQTSLGGGEQRHGHRASGSQCRIDRKPQYF